MPSLFLIPILCHKRRSTLTIQALIQVLLTNCISRISVFKIPDYFLEYNAMAFAMCKPQPFFINSEIQFWLGWLPAVCILTIWSCTPWPGRNTDWWTGVHASCSGFTLTKHGQMWVWQGHRHLLKLTGRQSAPCQSQSHCQNRVLSPPPGKLLAALLAQLVIIGVSATTSPPLSILWQIH